jgi:hypothetical protein
MAVFRVRGSVPSEFTIPVSLAPQGTGDTILWTGGRKIVQGLPQQAWYDVGFTGFVYETGYLPGLGGYPMNHDERLFIFDSGHDFTNSYLGFYLDTPPLEPPLADWFDNAKWDNVVLPAIAAIANKARELGFKGLVFDQELYMPELNQPALYWRWDYPGNTHNEWETRVQAFLRGQQVAQAIGAGLEITVYNVDWPDSLSDRKQTVERFPERYLYKNWFDGLNGGGLSHFRIADSHMYKDHAPEANWPNAISAQRASLAAAMPTHAHRWDGFAWITNGPKAQAQVVANEPVTQWDRHRQFGYTLYDRNHPTYVTDQIAAARAASSTLYVYAYNLVGNVFPYAGLL